MHAFLIVGDLNQEEFEKNLAKLGKDKERVIEFPYAKVVDLADLRGFTRLKLSEPTSILLKNFDRASEEAQNAFLKALEEPQKNLSYILTAKSTEGVCETIVSRCQIVETVSDGTIDEEVKNKVEAFINGDAGEKLNLINGITKRDEATSFMEGVIWLVEKKMLQEPNVYPLLEEAILTLSNLKANGNVGLQLTNFIVSIT